MTLCLCTDNVNFYVENVKELTKIVLIRSIVSSQDTKVLYKSIVFLCADNEQERFEIKRHDHFY